MSKIRGQDTKIEVQVRSFLHRAGFRFRKNVQGLPGKPDIVLPKYRSVVFVNGCFWHGHAQCLRLPKSNRGYWSEKIQKNIERDKKNTRLLRKMGWHVYTVWECRLKKDFEGEMDKLQKKITPAH